MWCRSTTPPVLAVVADQILLAGESLAFGVVATDADGGDTLVYNLADAPAGMSVDGATGALQWTAPYLDAIIVVPVTLRVSDGQGGEDQVSFNVTVDPDLLTVSSFDLTHTGYKVRFSHAVDPSTLNLYDGPGASWGAADAVLRDASNKPVAGSIVVDADAMGFTFVRTGTPTGNGVLAAGDFSLTLESRSDAFVDTHGRLLDGNADGVAGGAFAGNRQLAASNAAIVGIGEFSRGAGQNVNLPASGAGLPVRIGNAAGASSVSFTLHYDPALLDITGAISNLTGVTVTTDLTIAGRIVVQVGGITGLTNATTPNCCA